MLILRSIHSGNFTKAQGIRYSISAYTVGAMDSSGYFAGRIEARNHFAVSIQYFRIAVDLQAAHGMRQKFDRSMDFTNR